MSNSVCSTVLVPAPPSAKGTGTGNVNVISNVSESESSSDLSTSMKAPSSFSFSFSRIGEVFAHVVLRCFVVTISSLTVYFCVRLMLNASSVLLGVLSGGNYAKDSLSFAMTFQGFIAFCFAAFLLCLTLWLFSLVIGSHSTSKSDASDLGIPTKRNYHFAFAADKISNWHGGGFLITSFWNALSIFFPSGERMFMEAVRIHKSSLECSSAVSNSSSSPSASENENELHPSNSKSNSKSNSNSNSNEKLLECVNAFISQEGIHGREHECYNEIVMNKYPAVRWLEKIVIFLTEGVSKHGSKRLSLGVTIALEHWTAMLAGLMLNERDYALSSSDVNDEDGYSLVWKWHAMEEIEHRAVAFDVYKACYPDTFRYYFSRCICQITATVMFWTLVIFTFVTIIISESPLYFVNLSEWIRLFYFQFGKPGVFAKILSPYVDYFRRDFHPSQHNKENYEKLYEELKHKIEKFHHTAKNTTQK